MNRNPEQKHADTADTDTTPAGAIVVRGIVNAGGVESAAMSERWRAACHEAGHAVAGAVLGVRPRWAMLLPEGAGLCHFGPGGDDFTTAFISAAGSAAEHLADSVSAPTLPQACQKRSAAAAELERTVSELGGYIRSEEPAQPDWRMVALYASNTPDCAKWQARAERVQSLVGRLVFIHRAAILRIATELYRRGVLTVDDVNELLPAVRTSRAPRRSNPKQRHIEP